jgi:integrase
MVARRFPVPKLSLTDAGVRALEQPERGQVTYWDASLTSFGVRISQGGSRSWIVMLGSERRRVTIGRYPLISLADARKQAKVLLAEEALGKFRPARKAYEDAMREFLEECARKNKPRTVKDYTWHLTKHFPFARKSVADITPREVVRFLNQLNDTPSVKRHAYVVARAFFRWCIRQQLIEHSPVENVDVPVRQVSRDRVLDESELSALMGALRTKRTAFKQICLLLLYTGQRRGEIARLEWDWIGEDTITLPAIATKNSRIHTFPFGRAVAEILSTIPQHVGSPYVFPAGKKRSNATTVFNSWSKPKKALDEQCGVSDWTLHDLRRTFSSGMAALKVPQVVVEKLLNHVSGGTQSPIAQVYNRHQYMDEMREAVLQWEKHLDTLTVPEGLSNLRVS